MTTAGRAPEAPARRPGTAEAGGILLAAFLFVPLSGLAAQEPAEIGVLSDTTEQVDSTRIRIREQLEALGRPPGLDSARLARDSALLAEMTGRGGREEAGRAAPGDVGVRDSLATELLGLEGYSPTRYSGSSAEFQAPERILILRGGEEERPRVAREGMVLSADSAILFDEGAERVRALGNAEYAPQTGDPVESRTMVLDLGSARASALGARTRYSQAGTEWIVRGDLPSVESEIVYGSETSFTSCDREEPHYHFETDEIKIHAGNVLVARPVRLYFADVPVAWLPFIAQSLAEGRTSGLLTPRFSINDIVRSSSGYNRRISNVGFYWAMSEYTDAAVALDWFSDRFTSVNTTFRYRWNRQFLNGRASVNRYWRADGGTELAFNTSHQWNYSERTRLSVDARYASSNDFVRQNSFDPREVTRQITSQGGLNHRFDWGSVNLAANRRQSISDGKVEMTLPSVSLSLNPITFLQAPPSQAGFYNNVTWNGSVSASRRIRDFADQPLDSSFQASQLDQLNTEASLNSGFTLGNISLSQRFSYGAATTRGLPDFLLSPADSAGLNTVAGRLAAGLPIQEAERIDLTGEEMTWSAGASYQQRLIGSTTLTPRISVQSRAVRSDTLSASSNFVSAPVRPSFGARLKTDVFGFYPGVGSFERVRHKLSPSFSYDYSPEVTPSELQRRVFGSREIQTRSVVSLNLNQTFEASIEEEDADTAAAEPADTAAAPAPDTAQAPGPDAPGDVDGAAGGPAGGPAGRGGGGRFDEAGLERVETTRKVMLLGLQTSAVTYDFVEADSLGTFLGGFQTTTLTNTVRSDYLQGLSFQFQHDLFSTPSTGGAGGAGGAGVSGGRTFDPHLSSVNLSFSLSSSSSLFRWLGLTGGGDEGGDRQPPPTEEGPDAFSSEGADESSIVPGGDDYGSGGGRSRPSSSGVGRWQANLSYSLQRPRQPTAPRNQMVQATVNFRPTEHWDVNWRTSFDVERAAFNDHMIRLTRELHRWEANFDFRKTATGNWSFRFEVRLLDNQDLHFDYEQRSQIGTTPRR